MQAPELLSCGVIVVRRSPDGWRYLLLRAYQYWDFPKGLREPGEDPLAAALREVAEETTLTDLVFHWGNDFRETPPYGPHRKVARYYLAESPAGEVFLPVSLELGHPEHDEFLWCDYAAAAARVSARVQPILEWAVTVVGGGDVPPGPAVS